MALKPKEKSNLLIKPQNIMKSLDSEEDNNIKYKRFMYFSVFTIFGGLEGLLSIVITAILYYGIKPYNISEIWISTLGTLNNPYHQFFNIGLIISAVGLFCFGLMIYSISWNHSKFLNRIIKITIPFNLTTSIGIIILCLYDMESDISTHSIGAYMFFAGVAFIFGFYTWILKLRGWIDKSHFMVKFTGVYILIYILNIPISAMNASANNIKFSEMLGSMDPNLWLTRIFEWLLITLFFTWLLIAGVVFYNVGKKIRTEN